MIMKYIKIVSVLVVLALQPLGLTAQTTVKMRISATVKDADGKPVPDAVVRSEADNVSATTDANGNFSMEVTTGITLSVSASGYETTLLPALVDMREIILSATSGRAVAYGYPGNGHPTPGVSVVNIPALMDQNYITYPLDNMEGLVGGFHGNLWGMDQYLLLVDGVPRDVGSVMPTEIEQITFLKSAPAVALYGSRAAKGVIMITTKRGSAQERTVNVRLDAGVLVPKRYPRYLGSAEYMTLYNEARVNDGMSELYTADDIYHHASGTNPYRYPDVDFYSSDYLRKSYGRYDATVEISGGNDRARYYTNVGYLTEGSILNFGEAANNRNQRVNVRGNVDVSLNKFISATVDAAAIYYNGFGVNADFWGGAANLRPNRFAPLIPISMIEESDEQSWNLVKNSDHLIDGKYLLGGTQLDQTNPIAGIYAGGKNTYNSRQFQFNSGVNANLENLLKGLSFSSLFGIDYSTTYNLSFVNNYAVFQPAWNNHAGIDQISSLTKYGQDASTGEQSLSNSWYRQTLSFSGGFNYHTRLNDVHNISAMLLAGGFQQAITGIYHRTSNVNAGLHLGYRYNDKYSVDFNGALIHSAKLPEGNRKAFSPTVTLAWKVSGEEFMSGVSAVDHLKVFASAGILHTDLDITQYYLYESIYNQTDGAWYTWRDGLQNQSTDVRRGANPDLTFPKRKEISFGVDASLLKRLITFNGNFFVSRMTGIVTQNSVLFPSYFTTGYPVSSFIPYVNYNNDQRVGFDFNVKLNKRIGDVDLTAGLAGTYYTTKATRRAEAYEDAYQNRQGKPLDAIWGLESDGFFASQDDIDQSPRQMFGDVKPGDLRYKDQNNDGIINAQDEVYLGRGGWSGAPFTLGINLTATWKNFTFFVLGVARTGAYGMKNSNYFWVNAEDKYSEVVRGRWTEETKETATYPRLTTQNGNNNFRNSDFWLYRTSRFDLARVQVSYSFPKEIIGSKVFNQLGVYVNGANLLTIAPNRKILETNIGGAPQTRFFNLGVRAQF
jgi:TonB-linked SusC/RagA family outer membrane protein